MSQLEWLPAAFRKNLPLREVRAGATLFRQGDAVTAIFEVETGRLRLVRHAIDGHPIVLHTARAGELFAEAALFAKAYHCDAVAVTDSQAESSLLEAQVNYQVAVALVDHATAGLLQPYHVQIAELSQ